MMIGFRSRLPGDRKSLWELVFRLLLSCFLVLQSHLALAAVPLYLSFLPPLFMIPVSGVVMVATLGLGRWCRGLVGISAHAPASVLFHAFFLWGVYASVIRRAVPSFLDAAMNAEFALLLFGLYRIIFSDPGMVTDDYPEIPLPLTRVRFCQRCNAHVLGFDHHCPAFGNCIGRKNHRLFMALLLGFIITEASFVLCSVQFMGSSLEKIRLKIDLPGSFVISTLLFSLVQISWQSIFLVWHVYCVCFNIRTEEWINWKKYPEFHEESRFSPDRAAPELRFRNPYDNGFFCNIKEFLMPKGRPSSD